MQKVFAISKEDKNWKMSCVPYFEKMGKKTTQCKKTLERNVIKSFGY